MSPVAGLVRLRRHLFGRQLNMGTVVPATRAYPFSGTPDVDLGWIDPEVDAGARYPVAPPYRGPSELTASLDLPTLNYNDLTLPLCGFFGDDVAPTGGGTAKTWTHSPDAATPVELDPFTYQFGDDVLTDWYQFGDGVVESFEVTAPEGLGALSMSTTWRFGSVASTGSTDFPVTGTVPTAGLSVSTTDVPIFLKDCSIYIASSIAGLAAAQVTDAVHSFVFRGSQEIDLKRYANGGQTFDVSDYGPGAASLELETTFAKTADTVGTGSESDAWMSDTAVNRYIRFVFESTVDAQSGVPYSWSVTMPMRYYTREEGEVGQNSVIVLTARAFYDPTPGVMDSILINTLTEAQLGLSGS
jgi:hypothetical protein